MQKAHTRIIGAVAALIAAGLAGFTLRTPQGSVTTLAARNPATEVRTQVIRRTIHIVRHEISGQVRGPHGNVLVASVGGIRGSHFAGSSAVRTGASRSHVTASAGFASAGGSAAVTTRTSVGHASSAGGSSGASGGSSGGSPGGSSGTPVTTRTSPGHSSSGSSSGRSSGSSRGSGPVTTRSSRGGSGGDGGDGGKHGNGGNDN